MKVYDILTESKQVDEGPVRFLKRTLGKNTAMGKAAQLDVEIDQEVKSLFKDFYAVAKQDPKNQGMTAKGLANFLAGKGFVSSPKAVLSYINQDPSMGRQIAKGAKKVAGAAKKAGDAAKTGAKKVASAAKTVKDKLKPEPTKLTPKSGQGELDLQSMYNEAMINEVDLKLDNDQVKKVIKRFVQQGFQKQLGSRIGKSSYGDAPTSDKDAATPAPKGNVKMPSEREINKAKDVIQRAGLKVSK